MLCAASDTFRIRSYLLLYFILGMCRYIQSYSALLRDIHSYWVILKAYSGIFSTMCNPGIFTTSPYWALKYLKPKAHLKSCETLTRNIQNSVIGHYSAIFRHIQNLVQRVHMQKPGVLKIMEYSEPVHNCISMHIQSSDIFKTRYIFRTFKDLRWIFLQ